MLNEERKRKIVDITNERKSVTINELMDILGASQSTIRRDLSELNRAKMLKKVHGGAISLKNNILTRDETVLQRQDLNTKSKKAIAEYAASLIKENDVVYLDAGTTTAEMLPFLENVKAIYITDCISHARILAAYGHQVYLPGGKVKVMTDALIGADTLKYLEKMNFTIGFFGANGISIQEGFTTPDPEEGEIKRTAFLHCAETYILADLSKFNVVCTYTFAPIDKGFIVTDSSIPKAYKDLHNTILVDMIEKPY
ncbi:MAG: DeoR/GlpR transcriptional regulator [Erysipelotrichaceae bacterium]|nr:DeoR/GlpR transcriptional regulator [Erysipelotrichaceae bacterium]